MYIRMPMITVRVDQELKTKMEEHPEVNWSEVIRKAIRDELEKVGKRDVATALLLNEKNRISGQQTESSEEIRRWRSLLTPQ
jgi:Arc/MetJ-type ribon-helix-helix transcriptional regulator